MSYFTMGPGYDEFEKDVQVDEPECNRDDCFRDRDYCCDCTDGSLYRSPDSYREVDR